MTNSRKGNGGSLADRLLTQAQGGHWQVSVYLNSGFQLKGEIVDFDDEGVLVAHKSVNQLVMRSGIASMYPLPGADSAAEWWEAPATPTKSKSKSKA